jgi:hypothetical protein
VVRGNAITPHTLEVAAMSDNDIRQRRPALADAFIDLEDLQRVQPPGVVTVVDATGDELGLAS